MLHRLLHKMLSEMSHTEKIKLLPMINNFSWMLFEEIAQRAKTGEALYQPEGSTRKNFMDFRDLVFIPAQLSKFPLLEQDPVDTNIVIGPMAKKPLALPIPLMITGMGYGVSISKNAKLALCRASKSVNTALNSGESGFADWERSISPKYIVQYNRAKWGNNPQDLKKADAIEFRIGQGASASHGYTIKSSEMDYNFKNHLGVNHNQDAVMPNRFENIKNIDEMKSEVDYLKDLTKGVPIGVKISAGNIEEDIDAAIYCGFDFITIDGGEGGTSSSLEMTINNFGIPLVIGISKASRYLEKKGMKDKISLIAAGGAHSPGDFLKVMALGADAVYIGQPLLLSMVYHQAHKMEIGKNPVEMFLYGGNESDKLDIDEGAKGVSNFINASMAEIITASRCLGKNDLKQINKDDLRSLKEEVFKATGVKMAY